MAHYCTSCVQHDGFNPANSPPSVKAVIEGLFTLGSGASVTAEKRPAFIAALREAEQEKHIDFSNSNPVAAVEYETLDETGEGTIKVTVEWRITAAPLPQAKGEGHGASLAVA